MSRRMSRINTGTVSVSLRARARKGYALELQSRVNTTPAMCPDSKPETETDLYLVSWEREVDAALALAKTLFMERLTGMVQHRREGRRNAAARAARSVERAREWEDTTRLPDTSGTH